MTIGDRVSVQVGRGVLSVASGLILVVLATVGYTLPPPFDPTPLRVDPVFQTLPPQPPSELRYVPSNRQITTRDVTVTAEDGTPLGATIRAPVAPGRHPALVFVQGAGPGVRGEFTTQAEWLARAGIVTLVYDKRTVGYDFMKRDFGLLARDALRVLRELLSRDDVDPARVGLWGVSEGSWVVPLAANESGAVGFTVLVSAPNVSPMRQVTWALGEQLHRLYAPSGVRELLIRAIGAVDADFLRYDGLPALREMRQPVLALYGTRDPSIPFVESSKALTDALAEGGNDAYTIRYLDRADHGMRFHGGPLVPDYLRTLANWVLGLPGTATPSVHIAGATPVQRLEASDVPAAPWYAGGTVIGLTLCWPWRVRLRGRAGVARYGRAAARPGGGRGGRCPDSGPPSGGGSAGMAWTGVGPLVSVVAFIHAARACSRSTSAGVARVARRWGLLCLLYLSTQKSVWCRSSLRVDQP
ncbi:alpha/beta hydrolase family protein [Streptosporangium vulgare]|uniref:alpha/beta hydrolase family protein n=1 Tax=Streptosporangium vulgare TaxID=46190 RepID=UPI0031D41F01